MEDVSGDMIIVVFRFTRLQIVTRVCLEKQRQPSPARHRTLRHFSCHTHVEHTHLYKQRYGLHAGDLASVYGVSGQNVKRSCAALDYFLHTNPVLVAQESRQRGIKHTRTEITLPYFIGTKADLGTLT